MKRKWRHFPGYVGRNQLALPRAMSKGHPLYPMPFGRCRQDEIWKFYSDFPLSLPSECYHEYLVGNSATTRKTDGFVTRQCARCLCHGLARANGRQWMKARATMDQWYISLVELGFCEPVQVYILMLWGIWYIICIRRMAKKDKWGYYYIGLEPYNKRRHESLWFC